jgi:hypothetical protein
VAAEDGSRRRVGGGDASAGEISMSEGRPPDPGGGVERSSGQEMSSSPLMPRSKERCGEARGVGGVSARASMVPSGGAAAAGGERSTGEAPDGAPAGAAGEGSAGITAGAAPEGAAGCSAVGRAGRVM